jgi:hypothetical protein
VLTENGSKHSCMGWKAEVAWRVRTRELLAVELGHRVCDEIQPPGKLSVNLWPETGKRTQYGPVSIYDSSAVHKEFYTTDLQDPPTEASCDE